MERILYILALALFLLTACTLFDTRTPEEPDGDNSIFLPPTSPDIVIANLLEAVNTNNADNYAACFIASGYVFMPSNDAAAKYPSLFDNWGVNDEKQFMLSLTTTLGKANYLRLSFDNKEFATITADSALLVTNYILNFDLANTSYPTNYAGKASFTIAKGASGLWAISRWQDYSDADTEETISGLKARFGK
ncbi:MAG: hypothetical protein LBO69_08175 [Ignavibacteria bacterium]|jgi:hypothetical protein|nr:hypothetical protein [Ignavibacteria bacterium]